MKHENPTLVPNELASAVKGGYVSSAELIKDYRLGFNQETINSRTQLLLNNIIQQLSEISLNIDGLDLLLANNGTDIKEGSYKLATANAVFLFLLEQIESGSLTEDLLSNILNLYYNKDETYNREEINGLINRLMSQLPSFNIKVVNDLPTENISTTTLYLKQGEDGTYDLYIYVDGNWFSLGSTEVNLSGYVRENELNNLFKTVDEESIFKTPESDNIKIIYKSEIADNIGTTKAVGNINQGTLAQLLKGKEISKILDQIFFKEIWPTTSYSPKITITYDTIVKEGELTWPTVTTDYSDGGHIYPKNNDVDRVVTINEESLKYSNNTPIIKETISTLDSSNKSGSWTYQLKYSYPEGYFERVSNYDNRTNITVSEANNLTISRTINVTRPLIIVNDGETEELLYAIGTTFTIERNLIGNPVIKIPWSNSEIQIYVKDLGDYLPVNGWSETEEDDINGWLYKVFTKLDAYEVSLPHKITFKLIKS